jgi:hypothetical protein
LLASNARVGGINYLDGTNLPSKTAITGITIDLLRRLLPVLFSTGRRSFSKSGSRLRR